MREEKGNFRLNSAAVIPAKMLGLQEDLRLCGLAKSRLKGEGDARRESGERIFLPSQDAFIPLVADGLETLLVAHLRDEAHRFAISYHRKQRGKITSALDAIDGIGPIRRRAILRHFGSLTAVREASHEQLLAMPGLPRSVANAIYAWSDRDAATGPSTDDGGALPSPS